MRLLRYQRSAEAPQFGWVLDDKLGTIEGDPFREFHRLEANINLETVRILAPIQPGKIICIGRNYAEHAKEQKAEVPEYPILFMKPPSSIIGPGGSILLPPQSKRVEHEAELAVIIGRRGRWIEPQNALNYVFGYTIGMDITARDLQRRDGQWTRGKGFDTFLPLGPWIETSFDASDAMITCYVNEELRQMGSTRDMLFPVQQLIAFISSVMTLEPGDLILTGTPSGVGPLVPGDEVRASIEGIGVLVNKVVLEHHT
ncbi:MAG: fumarylacetoacetate hydrolase family protein [Chloroflexi bacterium]|nr:fumarylacetoacetate hydrolase family protein [Chloroflexota bacterium]